jgi:hypothetical protein
MKRRRRKKMMMMKMKDVLSLWGLGQRRVKKWREHSRLTNNLPFTTLVSLTHVSV